MQQLNGMHRVFLRSPFGSPMEVLSSKRISSLKRQFRKAKKTKQLITLITILKSYSFQFQSIKLK